MLEQYRGFFAAVESSPLNPAQARAVVNGERSLLVLAGAGSGKTSVIVARWLAIDPWRSGGRADSAPGVWSTSRAGDG